MVCPGAWCRAWHVEGAEWQCWLGGGEAAVHGCGGEPVRPWESRSLPPCTSGVRSDAHTLVS